MTDQSHLLYVKSLTIEGFGRFQEPTTIAFAPVTFLIGPNGAGKSTVGKALMLLAEAMGEEVAETDRIRGIEGTCRISWAYNESISPDGYTYGVVITYGNEPKIKEYFVEFEGNLILAYSISKYDFTEIYSNFFYPFVEKLSELEQVSLPRHNHDCSLIDIDNINTNVSIHQLYYERIELNNKKSIIGNKGSKEYQFSYNQFENLGLKDFVSNLRKLSNDPYQIANHIDESAIKVNLNLDISIQGRISNKSDFTENDNLNPYITPAPLDLTGWFKLYPLITARGSWIEYQKNNKLDQLYNDDPNDQTPTLYWPVQYTLHNLKNLGQGVSSEEIDTAANFAFQKAQITLLAKHLINLIKPFLSSINKGAPFKMSQSIRDLIPLSDKTSIESSIESLILKKFRDPWWYLNENNCLGSLAALKTITEQYNITGYKADTIHNRYTHFLVELEGGNQVPFKDIGAGLKSIITCFAWLMQKKFKNIDNSKNRLKGLSPGLFMKDIKTFIIEEIETLLHPKAQTELFKIILQYDPTKFYWYRENYEMTKEEHKGGKIRVGDEKLYLSRCLIFETHSEYVVRAALNMVASGKKPANHFAINYIHAPGLQPEGKPAAFHIGIRDNGTLMREFGPGFFDESQRLRRELIDLNTTTPEQRN